MEPLGGFTDICSTKNTFAALKRITLDCAGHGSTSKGQCPNQLYGAGTKENPLLHLTIPRGEPGTIEDLSPDDIGALNYYSREELGIESSYIEDIIAALPNNSLYQGYAKKEDPVIQWNPMVGA